MKQARLKVVNISSLSWVFMIFRNLVTLRPRKYPLPSQGYCQFCHTVQPWKTGVITRYNHSCAMVVLDSTICWEIFRKPAGESMNGWWTGGMLVISCWNEMFASGMKGLQWFHALCLNATSCNWACIVSCCIYFGHMFSTYMNSFITLCFMSPHRKP